MAKLFRLDIQNVNSSFLVAQKMMEKFWFYRKFWQSTQKQLEMTSSSSPSLKLFSSVFSFSLSLLRLGSDENVPFLRETNSLSRELDSRDNFKILKCHAMSSQDIAKRNFTSLHQTRNCFICWESRGARAKILVPRDWVKRPQNHSRHRSIN